MKSPIRTPFISSSALVVTVVPCAKNRISVGSTPRATNLSIPLKTAIAGFAGVLGIFSISWAPECSSYSTRSVFVPPTSTPKRYDAIIFSALQLSDLLTGNQWPDASQHSLRRLVLRALQSQLANDAAPLFRLGREEAPQLVNGWRLHRDVSQSHHEILYLLL